MEKYMAVAANKDDFYEKALAGEYAEPFVVLADRKGTIYSSTYNKFVSVDAVLVNTEEEVE